MTKFLNIEYGSKILLAIATFIDFYTEHMLNFPHIDKIQLKNIEDKLKSLSKSGIDKLVSYDPNELSTTLFHLHFIRKHKDSCIIQFDDKPFFFMFYVESKHYHIFIKDVLHQLIKCKENGSKIIVIPFFIPNHANMLIYNVENAELYRYEPHGESYNAVSKETEKEINEFLVKFTQDQKVIDGLGQLKYIPPSESCPKIPKSVTSGLQSMEEFYLQLRLSEDERRKIMESEGGGMCQVWSWFMGDMIMLNPNLSITDIYNVVHKSMNNSPKKFRELIRGFIIEVESELIKLNKDLSFKNIKQNKYKYETMIEKFYNDEVKKLMKNI